jgi:hypothetical protein
LGAVSTAAVNLDNISTQEFSLLDPNSLVVVQIPMGINVVNNIR